MYVNAGKIIGYLGRNAMAFYDEAKKMPDYDKYKYETAVRDLCVYTKREQGQYELTSVAKKVLKVVLGPAPDAPDYRRYWESRFISLKDMKERGLTPMAAEVPPVPLDPPEIPEKKAKKAPAAKKVKKK